MRTASLSIRTFLVICGVAAVAACGGDSTGPGTGGGGTASCTITLTGALTASPDCSGVTAIWTADSNTFLFGYFTSLSATPLVIVSVTSPGQPAIATYRLTDAGALGSAAVSAGSSGWVAQTADTSSGTAASGSYTLTITSISTITTAAEGKVYRVHGSFNATLPADQTTDATGTVTLATTF